jgi:hypothetical protein
MSPIPLGLDSEALSPASQRLWRESSSPDTILGHKSTCSESQLLGSRRGRPVGSVCVAVPVVAEATAGANRGRNHGRKQGLAPDPTGGCAAAPGQGRASSSLLSGAVAVERTFGGER